jgi:hypothetical protein
VTAELELLRDDVVVRVVPVEGSLSLGRDLSNQLVLVDPQVSGHHAVVETRGSSLVVRDLSSTNGTFVDDVLVAGSAALAHGAVLRLGENVRLRVHLTDDEVSGALVLRDEAAGTVHPIHSDRFVLGTAMDADVRLMSGPARAATLLTHADGEVWLGTAEGERPLEPGERFEVAGTAFVIELVPEDLHTAATQQPLQQARYPYTLTVTLDGAAGSLALLEGPDGKVEWSSESRVALLYILARQLGSDREERVLPPLAGWCHDEDVMVGVWGREGLSGAASKYSVLLHRVRKDIEQAGLDPWCVEKRRGATRLQVKSVVLS